LPLVKESRSIQQVSVGFVLQTKKCSETGHIWNSAMFHCMMVIALKDSIAGSNTELSTGSFVQFSFRASSGTSMKFLPRLGDI
jgi:hypothetical protein